MEQTMTAKRLACETCGSPLPFPASQPHTACATCGAEHCYAVFPAAFRVEKEDSAGERVVSDEESTCYVHPGKRAVEACGICGRFMCSLCDIPTQGKEICPECYSKRVGPNGSPEFRTSFFRFDRLALLAILAPLVIALPFLVGAALAKESVLVGMAIGFGFMMCVLTAPIGCFVAIRYRNAPLPPMMKRRFSKIVLTLAILECAAAALAFIAFCALFAIGIFQAFQGGLT